MRLLPWRGAPLKGEELSVFQKQVDAWNIIEEHQITKTFKFPDFRGALKFVNRVGELAEQQGHHPDISLAWGRVDITTWTHKINGLAYTKLPSTGRAGASLYPSKCRTRDRRPLLVYGGQVALVPRWRRLQELREE